MSHARRVIVEVRSGLLLGTKAIISPGETLRIGRTERAHLVVARDGQMSGLHCEIAWDGAVCTLRDHQSARGTQLGGERIDGKVLVPHGSWIQAGETSFSVYFEAHTPPRDTERLGQHYSESAERTSSDPAIAAAAPRALEVLRQTPSRLYAVLDAARDERVLELLHEAVDDHRSLYEGVKGEALAMEAPYLVCFRRDSGLLERVIREGWGRSWGVFVTSRQPFKAVRRHFRRFLMVEDEETAERMYFRFYDPRVLREFWPIATVRQLDDLGAGLEAFLLEGERGELLRFDAPATAQVAETEDAST